MPLTATQRDAIQQILHDHNVTVAYVFGSTARGTAGKTSDIDIAVLFNDELPLREQLARTGKLSSELRQTLPHDVDLVNLAEVTSPLLKHRAVIRGQLVHCSNHQKRQQLERAIFHEYEDTRHLRAVQSRALRKHIVTGTFGKPIL